MHLNLLYDMQIVTFILEAFSCSISQEFLFSLFKLVSTPELHFRHQELESQGSGQPPLAQKETLTDDASLC